MDETALRQKFDPDFLSYLQDNQDEPVAAIVRCDHLRQEYVREAETVGLKVTRRLRLIRGLAVEGEAISLLQMATASWVLRVEPDQPVHTMR